MTGEHLLQRLKGLDTVGGRKGKCPIFNSGSGRKDVFEKLRSGGE
jgi:hypothetical protein